MTAEHPPVPALGETLADPGPLPEDFDPPGYGDTPVTIRAHDAEALLVLAQRSAGGPLAATAWDVLGRVYAALGEALEAGPALVAVRRDDLVSVLADAEGFIGGKDNAAFGRLAAAAGVS